MQAIFYRSRNTTGKGHFRQIAPLLSRCRLVATGHRFGLCFDGRDVRPDRQQACYGRTGVYCNVLLVSIGGGTIVAPSDNGTSSGEPGIAYESFAQAPRSIILQRSLQNGRKLFETS